MADAPLTREVGCAPHSLINCTKCREAAYVRSLEDRVEALEAQLASAPPSPPVAAQADNDGRGNVPDGIWEALQRMIEDGMLRGQASREDAMAVARHRYWLMSAGARSGDIGALKLAAQLAGIPACDSCGFIKNHCRCAPQPPRPGTAPLSDEQAHALLERMAAEADDWSERLAAEPTKEQVSGWCVAFLQRQLAGHPTTPTPKD